MPTIWRKSLGEGENSIDPLTILPAGGSSCMIDKAVMDLPLPDLPTNATVSPRLMLKLTSSMAFRSDPSDRK